MQKTLFEEFIKYRAVILCWPFGDSFHNIIDTQKSFARLVMSLSVAAPVFIYVTNEEYDKAYCFRNYSMYTVHVLTDLYVEDTSSHLKSKELPYLKIYL